MNKEIRGVWIVNRPYSQVLTSTENMKNTMDFLVESGFNCIFPVVWNRGYTLFKSQVMKHEGFPEIAPFFESKNFDPLRELIPIAKNRGLTVIPWFEYGFAASPEPDGGIILEKKPQWSALNSQGKKVINGGLTWMNALDPDVQQFMLDLILEVAKIDGVDGIQGDDRLPALPVEGGYDPQTIKRYKQEKDTNPPNKPQDTIWVQWRADILTAFLKRLKEQVKGINRNLIVSMAPSVYPFSKEHYLQDTEAWIKQDLVDFLHPQIYRNTFSSYKGEVEKIVNSFTPTQRLKFAPGIALRANKIFLSVEDILQCVQLNRSSGFQGEIFFYLESLQSNNNLITKALKTSGGYSIAASLPWPFA